MKLKILIDTNVLIDVLYKDRPSTHESNIIFDAIRLGQMEGVITIQSIVDASYVLLRKGETKTEDFASRILSISRYVNIDSLGYFDLKEVCLHPGSDFEDDIQYIRARDSFCHVIVTNDRRFINRYTYDNSSVRFMTPSELVGQILGPAES